MAIIIETPDFLVEAPDQPLVDRNDGGHITITPRVRVPSLQQLSPVQAIHLMRLMMVVGEAMEQVMNQKGVDIGRINYQDNGNWGVFKPEGPYQHVHLYGRAKSAVVQKYGQACFFPHRDDEPEFYSKLAPLTDADVQDMRAAIASLLASEKFDGSKWRL